MRPHCGFRFSAAIPVRALAICLLALLGARAHDLPDGITLVPAFDTDGRNQFSSPLLLVEMPGRPGTFVVPETESGKIWLLSPVDEGYVKTLFATVDHFWGEEEMGISGFAFHPDYQRNGKFYVKHGMPMTNPPPQVALEERIASADRRKDSGEPPRLLLVLDKPDEFYRNHNGSSPVFGPDGFLYLGMGDGGWDLSTRDPFGFGQDRKTLWGKILRIDVDRKGPGLEYAIPPDNPFVADPDPKVRREIWAYGLRNPYRLAFDGLTGELYAGDVGSDRYEEVNVIKKGRNYGWSLKEGIYCFPDSVCPANLPEIEPPVLHMRNGSGAGQARCLVGGVVFRGDPASPFYGAYFFGDNSMQRLFGFLKGPAGQVNAPKDYGALPDHPVAFALDHQSNVYVVDYNGIIYRLAHSQLTAKSMAIRPSAPSPAGRGWRSAFAWNGRLAWPARLAGAWDAYTPAGERLGRVMAGDRLAAGREGLVLLRPAQ